MKKGEDYIAVTVSFLCHDGKGNVFLSKRSVNARDEHGRWDCGGGGVEFGDSVEQTLHKEIFEEYRAKVRQAVFLGYRDVFREQNGKKTHWISLDYLALIDPKESGNGEPHKLETVGWFPFSELPEPMHSQWPNFLKSVR